MFASKSTRGFYDPSINDSMPDDVVEISTALHSELLRGQSAGKVIVWGDDGCPLLMEPPAPTREVLAAIERQWRDERLLATDGVVSRHRDELEGSTATTLTAEQYNELQQYRQALRNWPETGEFPLIDHRPPPPAWLYEQTQ